MRPTALGPAGSRRSHSRAKPRSHAGVGRRATAGRQLARRTILAAALGALITISLLLAVAEAVASAGWSYSYSISHSQVAKDTGLDSDQIRGMLAHVISYARGVGATELQVPLPAGHARAGEPAFTQREIDHMADVRALFAGGRTVRSMALGLLAGAAALTLWTMRRAARAPDGTGGWVSGRTSRGIGSLSVRPADLWGQAFSWAAGWGAMILGIAALALTAGFSLAFDWFHLLFFRNDLWQLPPDSMLIALLPIEQFQRLGMLIAAGFVLGLLIAALLGWALRRRRRPAY